jgi:hypothetical protein
VESPGSLSGVFILQTHLSLEVPCAFKHWFTVISARSEKSRQHHVISSFEVRHNKFGRSLPAVNQRGFQNEYRARRHQLSLLIAGGRKRQSPGFRSGAFSLAEFQK